MCQALMEIMEPQLALRDEEKVREGLQQGIQGTVDVLRKLGHGVVEIKAVIMEEYGLSAEGAENYFRVPETSI